MLDKKVLINLLDEMALFLELKDANPFKIKAISNAARIIKSITENLDEIIESGKLSEIKGIGKGITQLIQEVKDTGKSKELEQLKTEIPAELVELRKIPGMGPKKIKSVWQKLNISNLGELEYACRENRLRDLAGFGIKIQDKILKGIQFLQKYQNQFLISVATENAEAVMAQLRQIPEILRCDIAGSIRRRMEYVNKIELIVEINIRDRNIVLNKLEEIPTINKIISSENQKIKIILYSGIEADLWIANPQNYFFLLKQITGSEYHNKALVDYANKMNFRFEQNSLVNADTGVIKCNSEDDIFYALNLPYIPPELREDRGEILAASQKKLPTLLTLTDIKGIIHAHTLYSDGTNSIEEMALACKERGFKYLVVSDHSKSAFYANGLSEEKIKQQHIEIDLINNKLENFTILKSIEADILSDGSLDYTDVVLASFDLVIASIHSKFNMTSAEATHRLLKAMENPYVTIIGHPTGRLLLAREGYPIDMRKIIESASALNVAIELNAHPRRLDIDWRFLTFAKENNVKISINPDAHQIAGIDDIKYGVDIARKGWLETNDVLNCLDVSELQKFSKSE